MDNNNTEKPGTKGNCPSCFKEAELSMCARCGDISYCSKECQRADWSIHKLLCEKLSKYQDQQRPRPRAKHFRAILFPADCSCMPGERQPRARFCWVKKCGPDEWDFGPFFEKSTVQEYTQEMCGQTKPIATQRMFVAHSHREVSKPQVNWSLQHLGPRGLCFTWVDDVLIVGADGDLNMRDFRAIVDYFQCYDFNVGLLDPSRYVGSTSTGVRTYCRGDMHHYNTPAYQEVHITTAMGWKLGMRFLGYLDDVMPLACSNQDPLSQRMPAGAMPPYATGKDFYWSNQNSFLLMLDLVFFTNCSYLKKWKEDPAVPTGSLTFVRSDLIPLSVQDFEDIQDFVTEQAKKLPADDALTKKALVDVLTLDNWQRFLARKSE